MPGRRIYYFGFRRHPARIRHNSKRRGEAARRRPGGSHGNGKFRHRRPRLAAARQLGPAARIPHRARAGDDEEARPRRHALHVRRERALHHRHADAGLEPAQAGPALRHAVRRRRGRSCSSRATSASRSSGTRPWIPKENVRHSFAWIKGAAGPASTQQVNKFTKAVLQAMKDNGVAGQKLGCRLHRHQHDQHLQGEQHQLGRRHDPDDGGARGQEPGRAGMLPHRRRDRRRHALGVHEVPAPRHHREPGDRAPDAVSLQHPRHGGRRGRHRVVRPEHLAELAQLLRPHHPARRHRVHGFGRAHLERLQVLLLPHLLRRQGAVARSSRTPTRPRSSGSTTRSAR